MTNRLIYLDCAATTPVSPLALEAMRPLLAAPGRLGGCEAVARAAGVEPEQVWLCSGGSAANNAALKALQVRAAAAGRPGVASQLTEHPSVLKGVEALAARGVPVQWLPLDAAGQVTTVQLEPGVGVVSVMLGNNETGTLQPVADLARRAREQGALVHVDAVQGARWLDVHPLRLGADLVTLSAHKLGGPKGVGALLGEGVGWLPAAPGAPEALSAGFAAALEERSGLRDQARAVATSRDALQRALAEAVEGVVVNGGDVRLPGHLNLTVLGISGEALVMDLDGAGIAVSAGSACSTGEPGPSHVLLALGRSRAEASASVRFSLGDPLADDELERVVGAVTASIQRLRQLA